MTEQPHKNTCVITYEEYEIIKKVRQLTNETNRLAQTSDMVHQIEPFETCAMCVEEVMMLLEFRLSRYNYRMDKIKLLKDRWKRIFH